MEVANILKEMLEDIKTRREVIDKVCFASARAPSLPGYARAPSLSPSLPPSLPGYARAPSLPGYGMLIPMCLHMYA